MESEELSTNLSLVNDKSDKFFKDILPLFSEALKDSIKISPYMGLTIRNLKSFYKKEYNIEIEISSYRAEFNKDELKSVVDTILKIVESKYKRISYLRLNSVDFSIRHTTNKNTDMYYYNYFADKKFFEINFHRNF
ncbi:MAG: hypothetical protein D8M58_10490 [Calditrichaeota bacterium]|nr:MAG: hypothetical protein DWQ03_09865 [Calditrichota bacterium]MBL1205818.1 hypothetical protein [Calditrichota bacterium]